MDVRMDVMIPLISQGGMSQTSNFFVHTDCIMVKPQSHEKAEDAKNDNEIQVLSVSELQNGMMISALKDNVNFNIKHPLSKEWTLWYDTQQKKVTQANWHDNLKNLITFSTVEDFWGYVTFYRSNESFCEF